MKDVVIEEIEQVGKKIDELAAIRALLQEVDSCAKSSSAGWKRDEQLMQATVMRINRQLARVMRTVPDEFRNGHLFNLKWDAPAIQATEMMFHARMAVGVWMLDEWEKKRCCNEHHSEWHATYPRG